jgi:hypothetical protein
VKPGAADEADLAQGAQGLERDDARPKTEQNKNGRRRRKHGQLRKSNERTGTRFVTAQATPLNTIGAPPSGENPYSPYNHTSQDVTQQVDPQLDPSQQKSGTKLPATKIKTVKGGKNVHTAYTSSPRSKGDGQSQSPMKASSYARKPELEKVRK